MTVKDVVELSAVYLQLEDVLSKSDFVGSLNATTNPSVSADDLTTRTVNILIRCTDLALQEIASESVKLLKTETISAESNEVAYTSFSNKVLKVLSVSQNGKSVEFKQFPTCIEVAKKGSLEFCYYYLPTTKTLLLDNIDEVANLVSIRTIAYGVAAKYCFISSLFAEAQMWEEKFKNSLCSFAMQKEKTIKARGWF